MSVKVKDAEKEEVNDEIIGRVFKSDWKYT
jgi:hypothetical protein